MSPGSIFHGYAANKPVMRPKELHHLRVIQGHPTPIFSFLDQAQHHAAVIQAGVLVEKSASHILLPEQRDRFAQLPVIEMPVLPLRRHQVVDDDTRAEHAPLPGFRVMRQDKSKRCHQIFCLLKQHFTLPDRLKGDIILPASQIPEAAMNQF